jgi:peptidoglycan/LPS O-acetylase OafA/YrhL
MQSTEYMFVPVTAPATAPKAAPAKGRDRYLDTLRAIAIFRVVFYHGFGFSWLPWVPAMGIMFALAGSLMVRSIDKSAKQAVISRFRRLVPVVWAFGLIWVPLMIWHDGGPSNWAADGTPAKPVWQLAFWILPAGDPPGSQWGEVAWGVLWYLKTYLWFVALSPVLLWAFRKRSWTPWLVFPLPFLLMVAADHNLIPSNGWYGSTLYDTLTYMGCWLIGFAHGTGLLKRLPLWLLVTIGGAVAGLGLWYMSGPGNAQAIDDGAKTWVIENSNFALGLYSFGIVFILMRFSSRMEWLKKHPIIDRIITIMNARAVTIYLWHNSALTLSSLAADKIGFYPWYFWFPLTWVLIFGFVLGFGWVEDFAARRKPELLPGKKKKPAPTDAAAATEQTSAVPGGEPQRAYDVEATAVGGFAPVSPGPAGPGRVYGNEPQYQDARYGDGRYDDRRYRDDRYDDRYQDAAYQQARYQGQGGSHGEPYQERDHDRRPREYGGGREYEGRQHGSREYGSSEYGARGNDPRGYEPHGHDQRVPDQGRYDQGTYDQGGYDQGRYDQGGYDQRGGDPRDRRDQRSGGQDDYRGDGYDRGRRYPAQEYGAGQRPPAQPGPSQQPPSQQPPSQRFPSQQYGGQVYGAPRPGPEDDRRTTYGGAASVPRPRTFDDQPRTFDDQPDAEGDWRPAPR